MEYILGAYSQLPFGSTMEEYETLLSRQLKPLLTMVYRNSSLKLLFRLGISEFEYLEQNHPEVNMLINDLCRKGQLELLSSSYYDVVLSLIPTHERTSQIEKTTTYIRKNFSRKPRGLWFYNQVFNPTTVPNVSLAGLDYIVVSTYNQVSGITESTRPFYTEEMGKQALVFPIDDRYSKETADLYGSSITLEKYLSNIRKMASENTSSISTIMLNLDQLMGTEGSSDVFKVIYDVMGNRCTLPSIYLSENEIARTHYLPGGIYGRDFRIGKLTSINQLIYENPKFSRNYGLVNMLREIVRDSKRMIEDRKNMEQILMKASSSSLYFPDECGNPAIHRSVNRYSCEMEVLLSRIPNMAIPEETDIDFDRIPESLIAGKSNITYLSHRGAVLSRYIISSALTDLAFHSGDGLFADSFINDKTSKEMKLAAKPYDVTPLDKRRTDFFAKAPALTLGKNQVNLTKRYKFRQSTLIVEIEIENLSDIPLNGFTYMNTINLALPCECEANCPEGAIVDGGSCLTQSVVVSDRCCPFNVSFVFGEEAEVSRSDFMQKAHTWLGDKSFYEYTQLSIQKKLSLGPDEVARISIGFRTEKRKEKHNDTTEQSTS